MDEDPPLPPNRPYRIRRASSSIISSTTSAFPAPANPAPHGAGGGSSSGRSRGGGSALLQSLSSTRNNSNNNNGRDVDEDGACQPSSSTTNFTPPSSRLRSLASSSRSNNNSNNNNNAGPVSPLGSPDSTFWGPAPSPITTNNNNSTSSSNNQSSFRQGPATPGGMCVVSSSTADDIPPSPLGFSPSEELTVGNSNNVMLPSEVVNPGSSPLHSASSSNRNNNNQNNSSNPLGLSSSSNNTLFPNLGTSNPPSTSSPSSSAASSSASFPSSSNSRHNPTLRNKIKKASSFERFSLQAANNSQQNHAAGSAGVQQSQNPAASFGDNQLPLSNNTNSSRSNSNNSVSSNGVANSISSSILSTASYNPSSTNNSSMGLSSNNPILAASLSAPPSHDQDLSHQLSSLAHSSSSLNSIGLASNSNNNSSGSFNTNSIINQASGSSSNSSGTLPTATNNSSSTASKNGTSSSTSSSTRFWDSIIQSSGASALRQLFSNSNEVNKSLHIKIPSKKLAAKIASVFEQEELLHHQQQQQQQQQHQNELIMNSLLSTNSSSSNQSDQPHISPSNNGDSILPNAIANHHHNHHQLTLPGPSVVVAGSSLNTSVLGSNTSSSSASSSYLNHLASASDLSGAEHGPAPPVSMELMGEDSHENLLIRELSDSPLNLTESSANNNNSSNSSTSTSHSQHSHHHIRARLAMAMGQQQQQKKMPLTPKQKLLHRMQSGERLTTTPPPPGLSFQQQSSSLIANQQQQGSTLNNSSSATGNILSGALLAPPSNHGLNSPNLPSSSSTSILASSLLGGSQGSSQSILSGTTSGTGGGPSQTLTFQSQSLLQESLQQPPHTPPQQHLVDTYEGLLLRSRDEFMTDLSSSKAGDVDGGVSVLYDSDTYSYYYGNMLGDEIFATASTTSSSSAASRPMLMLPQGGCVNTNSSLQDEVDSLQSHQQHPQGVDFVLGMDDPDPANVVIHDGRVGGPGRDDIPLDAGQFLVEASDNNLHKVQTDSTLRSMLMMGPLQHDDASWICSGPETSTTSSRLSSRLSLAGVSQSLNSGLMGSSGNPLGNTSSNYWMLGSDWSRNSWGHLPVSSAMQEDEQDEVMDMSIMDSPDKHMNNKSRHLVDHHDIDDVDLLDSMQMPMDLQQPLGLMAGLGQGPLTGAGASLGLGKSQLGDHDLDDTNNPINLQHSHRLTGSPRDDEPVNLISVNINDIGGHHSQHQQHHHGQEDMDHLPSTVLQHSSMLNSSRSHHVSSMGHLDSNKQNQMQCGGYITLHAAPQTEYSMGSPDDLTSCQSETAAANVNTSSNNNTNNEVNISIDERRIIRVQKKKNDLGQLSPDAVIKLPATSSGPAIILDKPIQPKSFASLPHPLSLVRISGNGDWAVFTARLKTIAMNTRFGPVEGPLQRAYKEDLSNVNAVYPCLVMLDPSNTLWQLDRVDEELCNWMKFVRLARNSSEQNAVVSEERGLLYFTTTKDIPPKTELQIGYAPEYAQKYGLSVASAFDGTSIIHAAHPSERSEISITMSREEDNRPEILDDVQRREDSVPSPPLLVPESNRADSDSFTEIHPCFECQDTFPSLEVLTLHTEEMHPKNDNLASTTTNFVSKKVTASIFQSVNNNKRKNLKKSKFLEEALSQLEKQEASKTAPILSANDKRMSVVSNSHIGVSKEQGKHECPTCKVVVPTLVDFKKHVDKHFQQGLTTLRTEENKEKVSEVRDKVIKSVLTPTQIQFNKIEKMEDDGKEIASSTSASHHGSSKVKCTMCYKSFATKDRLDKHMIVHSDEETKPLRCEFCPKRFLTNSALAGHTKTHAEEGKCFECPMCDFVTQQLLQLKEHVQSHKSKENGMFCCPKCNKKFRMYSMVRKHIRAFHGPRQFSCDQCAMSFPTSDKLKLHKLKHSDHREFLCAECGRQFKRKDKLREHTKRMHENRKKPVDIHALAHLSRHRHIKKFVPKTSPEEFEKFIYKCLDCMMGFKRRGMLVNHLAKRHPEKPPQQVPELNMPILRPTRNYFCPYCDRVYKSSSKRKSHILKSHPGKALPPQLKGKDSLCVNEAEKLITVCVSTSDVRLLGGKDKRDGLHQQYREVSVVGKVMATPHSCQWCHRQYATRAKLLQHQRKAHLHLMPADMQLPRTQKNNVLKSEESINGNPNTTGTVIQTGNVTSGNIIAGNITINANGIVSASSDGTVSNNGHSQPTSVLRSNAAEVIVAHILKNEVLTDHVPSSSTSALSLALAPDSSTHQNEAFISVESSSRTEGQDSGNSTIVVTNAQSSSSPTNLSPATVSNSSGNNCTTTAITLNEAQLHQLQLQGLTNGGGGGNGGEETGNVIGFLLTTTSVNGELGTLMPSEIVVVPLQSHHNQTSQHQNTNSNAYPVISASTAQAIQQAVLSTTSGSGGSLSAGTLIPINTNTNSNSSNNASNNNNICNVISNAVAGINTVNPVIQPTD